MIEENYKKNMVAAFEHLAQRKKATPTVLDGRFRYTTKSGIEKEYVGYISIQKFLQSEHKKCKFERVNSFVFAQIRKE